MATIASNTTAAPNSGSAGLGSALSSVLGALGSLKLTVALFACSLIIVLVGTLAQDEMNMPEVKERYFLSWIAPLHIDDFFPQAFMLHEKPIPGVIPFPGGALIGLMLMVNLLAAKTTRFKIHAKGARFLGGVACMITGAAVGAIIITAGHSSDGLQGTPPISYDQLWWCVLGGTALLGVGAGVASTRISNSTARSIAITAAVTLGVFVLYAIATGFRIGDPGLRIVWQLTKGLGAGLILLVGCNLLFGRQGGNMLLHLGVALLMVGQFAFGDRQLEQRLSLIEGESTNTFVNLDAVELAFIETLGEEQSVAAIPGSRLRQACESETVISDPALPFDVRVNQFFDNSTLKDVTPANPATRGVGLEIQASEVSRSGGTDSEINIASAYVELLDKSSGDSLGTHLVSQLLSDRKMLMAGAPSAGENVFDTVTAGDREYELGLKFHREVKPYWVQLEDVRRINYSGSDTPRDYSSFIRIVDTETGEDRKERVWMNNPLRYRGETFYQSSYQPLPGGKELTGIQVVRNSGWLIPYVACSVTAIGMLAHFLGTLTRFLRRREREAQQERKELAEFNVQPPSNRPVYVAVALVAAFAVVLLVPWSAVSNNMRPSARAAKFDWYTAGKIPVQFGGRVMPLDAYARQTLKAISSKESLPLDTAPAGIKNRVDGRKLSAIQWLMEVSVDEPQLRYLPMLRIDAGEVRDELGLERRESKLFSLDEILVNWGRADEIVKSAVNKEPRDQSFKERKLLELDRRTRQFSLTAAAFRLPVPQEIPAEEFKKVFPDADDSMRQLFALRELQRRMDALKSMSAPAIVAPLQQQAADAVNDPQWLPFGSAFFDHVTDTARTDADTPPVGPPGVDSFGDMIKAYGDNDTEAFNAAVDTHLAAVQAYPIRGYSNGMVSLERWMQSNWPTGVATLLYLICLVLGLVYFMVNLPRLRMAVWGTLAVAVAVHTVAIVCRITITGRAPVINLYSSAVFIGWAAVLAGLVIERIFRYGTGNMLSAAAGVLTLLVAYGLNTGDTMPVLQAVLDTQFWLATHVISVTLGYVSTLVAGTLGAGYLIAGWLRRDKKSLHNLYRSAYGAACFGILFSFVGTVLGGLWADDSWGRFWGWDPKENGALLIVIWNALLLHARWDGMVGPRGFAAMAIGGNIVTAWSWFGTNELGIGLHSYGFTSGVLMWLSLFIGVQLAFVAIDGLTRMMRLPFGKPT